MKVIKHLVVILAISIIAVACSGQAEPSTVSGMVTNADNAVIPEGATATILIEDVSLADAPAKVIGEQIIENPESFPFAYEVSYDSADIVENHTYSMRARITYSDGTLLFINDTSIPVITNGNPTENVEIPVIQTYESAAAPEGTTPLDTMEFVVDPALVNVVWEWTQRTENGGEEVVLTVLNPEDYNLLFNEDGTFFTQVDCNNASGEYATDGNGNIFMQLGPMTRAACSADSLSNDMVNMFGPAQSYVFEDDGATLIFKWAAGGPWDYFQRGEEAAKGASVSGTVTNADAENIPEGATASIKIEDTSLADAPAKVMGEQIIENPEQFPFAYSVSYDPDEIVDNHTYTMRARIESAAGELLFINDTAIPVITNGNPTEGVEIPVIKVGD